MFNIQFPAFWYVPGNLLRFSMIGKNERKKNMILPLKSIWLISRAIMITVRRTDIIKKAMSLSVHLVLYDV